MKVSFVLPTLNEVDNIVPLIKEILHYVPDAYEFIIADDDSRDGTCESIEEYSKYNHCVKIIIIRRKENHGLTNSIRDGINIATGDVVLWMDCDFSMPPCDIPKLLNCINHGYDIAVGSRFIRGGRFKENTKGTEDSALAVFLSRMMNYTIQFLLDYSFKDYTSGFIAIKTYIVKKLEINGDYGEYFIDLIFRAIKEGYKIIEIPYVCLPREKGESKTGSNISEYIKRGIPYITTSVKLRLRYGFSDRKQRKEEKLTFDKKSVSFLNKDDTEQNFKTDNFKEVGELCRLLKLDEDKSTTDIHSEEIDTFLDVVKDVKSGKIVDLKKYQLKETNPIFIKNQENILENDPIESKEILKNYTDKESQICQKAFLKFVTFATKKEIIESGYIINKKAFETIINRYINGELELSIEDITSYLKNFTYSAKEFIELAKRLKVKLNPDAVIVFYDKLYASYPEALEGYLYLLFELQMIDSIREIITDCDAPVCKKYEYLLFLRDSGKNFHIELFT